MARSRLKRGQLELSLSPLFCRQQYPFTWFIDVNEGSYWIEETRIDYAGGTSPDFEPFKPVSNSVICLLVIDSAGTLSIVSGVAGVSPVEPAGSTYSGKMPICKVTLASSTTGIEQSLIKDIRPVLNLDESTALLHNVKLGSEASGQIFTIDEYQTGNDTLEVYQNGQLLTIGTDYIETNSTTITIDAAIVIETDDIWTFRSTVASFSLTTTDQSGTPSSTWTINNDFTTGAPFQDGRLIVLRGDENSVEIKYNETDDKWEFTNDGVTYSDLGAGGTSKSVTVTAVDGTYSFVFVTEGFVDFSSTNFSVFAQLNGANSENAFARITGKATTGFTIELFDANTALNSHSVYDASTNNLTVDLLFKEN